MIGTTAHPCITRIRSASPLPGPTLRAASQPVVGGSGRLLRLPGPRFISYGLLTVLTRSADVVHLDAVQFTHEVGPERL